MVRGHVAVLCSAAYVHGFLASVDGDRTQKQREQREYYCSEKYNDKNDCYYVCRFGEIGFYAVAGAFLFSFHE